MNVTLKRLGILNEIVLQYDRVVHQQHIKHYSETTTLLPFLPVGHISVTIQLQRCISQLSNQTFNELAYHYRCLSL
jgi:hypothetical protein